MTQFKIIKKDVKNFKIGDVVVLDKSLFLIKKEDIGKMFLITERLDQINYDYDGSPCWEEHGFYGVEVNAEMKMIGNDNENKEYFDEYGLMGNKTYSVIESFMIHK